MGAVLAMRTATRSYRRWGLSAAILALSLAAGCDLVGKTLGVTGNVEGIAPQTISDELLIVSIPSRGAQATLGPVARNGDVTVWQTLDGITLSFRGGVLTGTRGLGDDLMSADVSNNISALLGQHEGYYPHFRTYIDGENRTVFRSFQCRRQPHEPPGEIAPSSGSLLRLEEICVTTDSNFTNTYWLDKGGRITRSRQWVSPGIGHLETGRAPRP